MYLKFWRRNELLLAWFRSTVGPNRSILSITLSLCGGIMLPHLLIAVALSLTRRHLLLLSFRRRMLPLWSLALVCRLHFLAIWGPLQPRGFLHGRSVSSIRNRLFSIRKRTLVLQTTVAGRCTLQSVAIRGQSASLALAMWRPVLPGSTHWTTNLAIWNQV